MMFRKKLHKDVLIKHYEAAWGIKGMDVGFDSGPIKELPDGFAVLEYEPHGERDMWTYASCCMSLPGDKTPLELHIFSPQKSVEPVELLVATAHYHRTGATLGLGHTINFGKGWIDSSQCEYGLISLPYLDGPILENLELSNGKVVNCLWLIPITKSEVEFKKANGLEALEKRFEKAKFNFLDPMRAAVC